MLDTDPTEIDIHTDPLQMTMTGVAIHGNTPFSVPYISHIEGNLWTGGCDPSLTLPEHIEHVVSLYPWQRYRIEHRLKSEMYVRMYDSSDEPDPYQVERIAAWAAGCVQDGPTLISCQAGLNRSALIATATLTLLGQAAGDAIALLREKRSPAVLCNKTFEAWLLREM